MLELWGLENKPLNAGRPVGTSAQQLSMSYNMHKKMTNHRASFMLAAEPRGRKGECLQEHVVEQADPSLTIHPTLRVLATVPKAVMKTKMNKQTFWKKTQ